MICQNCEATFESKFCPDCGQKSDIHRISIKHIIHDVVHAFTHADKGFLLLVKELLVRPGFVAREFVNGKRKKYFNPLSFLVITSALLAYFSYLTGYLEALTAGSTQRAGHMPQLMTETFAIGAKSGKELTLFLMAPLFAFLSWLFFIRSKYNYAENFALNSFIFGEAAIIRTAIFIPLHVIFPELTKQFLYFVYEPLFIIYLVVAFKQFFGGNIFLLILKAILVRILFLVFFWALIFAYVYFKHLIFK